MAFPRSCSSSYIYVGGGKEKGSFSQSAGGFSNQPATSGGGDETIMDELVNDEASTDGYIGTN